MTRLGITYNAVEETAEKILAEGENPTIEKIRFSLGTGSNSTIAKYLQEWRGKRLPVSSNVLPASNTPPDLVNAAVARVWQQIREETNAEVDAIKVETQSRITEAENKVLAYIKEVEKLHTLCNELQEQVHALQAKNEIQQLDYKKLQAEYTVLQERHKNLDERYIDFQRITAKHQDDMGNSHKNEINLLLENTKAQESTYQKLINELKIHNEDQRQRHMLEMDTLQTLKQQSEKNLDQLRSTVALKDLELHELKIRLSAMTKERDALAVDLSKQEGKNTQLTDKIWVELKEVPKFDVSLSYVNYFSEIQHNIHVSMEKLGKITNDAKATFEMLNNKFNVKMNDE